MGRLQASLDQAAGRPGLLGAEPGRELRSSRAAPTSPERMARPARDKAEGRGGLPARLNPGPATTPPDWGPRAGCGMSPKSATVGAPGEWTWWDWGFRAPVVASGSRSSAAEVGPLGVENHAGGRILPCPRSGRGQGGGTRGPWLWFWGTFPRDTCGRRFALADGGLGRTRALSEHARLGRLGRRTGRGRRVCRRRGSGPRDPRNRAVGGRKLGPGYRPRKGGLPVLSQANWGAIGSSRESGGVAGAEASPRLLRALGPRPAGRVLWGPLRRAPRAGPGTKTPFTRSPQPAPGKGGVPGERANPAGRPQAARRTPRPGDREPEPFAVGGSSPRSRTGCPEDRGGASLTLPGCHWLRTEATSQSPQTLTPSSRITSVSAPGPAPLSRHCWSQDGGVRARALVSVPGALGRRFPSALAVLGLQAPRSSEWARQPWAARAAAAHRLPSAGRRRPTPRDLAVDCEGSRLGRGGPADLLPPRGPAAFCAAHRRPRCPPGDLGASLPRCAQWARGACPPRARRFYPQGRVGSRRRDPVSAVGILLGTRRQELSGK